MKRWLEGHYWLGTWGAFVVASISMVITLISTIDEPISPPPMKDFLVWVPTMLLVGLFFFGLYVGAQKRRRIRRETLEAEFQANALKPISSRMDDLEKAFNIVVRQFTEFKKAVSESREEGGQMVADGILSLDNLLAGLSDPNLTDLQFQKSQIFERYQNKRVKWEGRVRDVSRLGEMILLIYTPSSESEKASRKAFSAVFPDTAEQRLSELSENDWILIEGTIDFGRGKEPRLVDAELIDFKKEQRED